MEARIRTLNLSEAVLNRLMFCVFSVSVEEGDAKWHLTGQGDAANWDPIHHVELTQSNMV